MIMLLYDMKFRIALFGMIEPLPCILFFPIYFLVSTQHKKPKQTFKFCNGTPTSITDIKDTITFSAIKSLYQAKIKSLHMIFFSLQRGFLCKFILFDCSFYTRHSFFVSGARTFNMDERDRIAFRHSVYYTFSKQIQLTKLIHKYILLN